MAYLILSVLTGLYFVGGDRKYIALSVLSGLYRPECTYWFILS